MKRSTSAALALALILWAESSAAAFAETASSIVGTWRVTSSFLTVTETKEIDRPFGENLTGYIQYSPGGHVVVFISAGDPKRPADLVYSDADRAEIHKGIIAAYAGTYSVDGNKITHHVVAGWLPGWIGSDQVRFVEIDGDDLTIKTAPLISARTGKEVFNTLTFKRVE